MIAQENVWFEKLHSLSAKVRDALYERGDDQIWDAITSPYSDQAHFVYELLQNADDCKANEATFELFDDRLVFTHDGTVRFTVSDPERNASLRDRANGMLGHLNAITGTSKSTKDGNCIGKFGIGFKSVFLYTATPHIYDDGMCFKIEDFIVPCELASDYPGRKQGTTVFVFPFNQKMEGQNVSRTPAEDIREKLCKLVLPTLFLRHLKKVTWKCDSIKGEYKKECEDVCITAWNREAISAQFVTMTRTVATGISASTEPQRLLVFSRPLASSELSYSVAFGLDAQQHVVPLNYPPFCFFPTKVDAQLKFIVHAPFLLTSDRSGISEATALHRETNQQQLNLLADLLADSIVAMRDISEESGTRYLDDNLVTSQIIPLKTPVVTGWEHLNLKAMYEKPLSVFKEERVIPYPLGYCVRAHAYVASRDRTISYFDDSDLCSFVEDEEAHWVFREKHMYEGKINQASKDTVVLPYIGEIVGDREGVTSQDILSSVEGDFIESKFTDVAWLQKFYKWVCSLNREECQHSADYSILLDQSGHAVSANDARHPLYLPVDGDTTFRTLHERLYALPEVKELVEDVYHLRKPAREDLIEEYARRAKEAKSDSERDTVLKLLMKWACTDATTQERNKIVEHLKNPDVGHFKTLSTVPTYKPASALWRRNQTLEGLFAEEPRSALFIDEACYSGIANGIPNLLEEIGICGVPRVSAYYATPGNNRNHQIWGYLLGDGVDGYKDVLAVWFSVVGVDTLLKRLHSFEEEGKEVDDAFKPYSLRIWNALACLMKDAGDASSLEQAFSGTYVYRDWHGKTDKKQTFTSPLVKRLRTWSWVLTRDARVSSPTNLTWENLPAGFVESPYARQLCRFLNIPVVDEKDVQKVISALPEHEQQALALGKILQDGGVSNAEDVERALKLLKSSGNGGDDSAAIKPIDKLDDLLAKTKVTIGKTVEYKKRREQERQKSPSPIIADTTLLPADDEDDVMHPKTVDFDRKIQDLQEKLKKDIAEIERDRELQDVAVTSADYSYAWLRSRLDLEIRASGADDTAQHEATVTFGKIEKEVGTIDTFVLSLPSCDIPQWFEDEVNQVLELHIPGRNDIRTVIKSMSVKQFRLEARIEILPGMEGLDYSTVTSAKTSATKPAFLLNSLRSGYESLGFNDDYDLKSNLPTDIRFIFGPPGTGKTTHLARKELIPLAESEEHPHVLVLTPTNKAADVLVKRIIKEKGEDNSYVHWLSRFGHAVDQELQATGVAIEKRVRLRDGEPAVVVTTIPRFAYDVFQPTDNVKIPLASVRWDYVVVDEASMIPLMHILYPLYRARDVNPNVKFIIAGDPMQIEPVVVSEISQGENIYTMVRLDDFANPTTEPHPYEVLCLDTQYRSVPCVGDVFSKFAYSGLLKHGREGVVVEPLRLNGMPEIRPLTLLRFPVDRNASIYRVQKLANKSSYHVYAALFTFEYVSKVVEGLKAAGRIGFRIGIISPYRAQAEIIGRLVDSSKTVNGISVQVGTVHGFQGDECDMIIAMLNPPRGMGMKSSIINNVKVLNVAVSRARDYLVVAMPREKTYGIEFLTGPLKIASLMREHNDAFVEYQMPDIERLIWGDDSYIDHNTYPTGHQSVNVYETPEKRFEVRAGEEALDVQYHEDRSHKAHEGSTLGCVARIDAVCDAENATRAAFVVPPDFHEPLPGEEILPEQKYYIMGKEEFQVKNVGDEIDMSQVLAIED